MLGRWDEVKPYFDGVSSGFSKGCGMKSVGLTPYERRRYYEVLLLSVTS